MIEWLKHKFRIFKFIYFPRRSRCVVCNFRYKEQIPSCEEILEHLKKSKKCKDVNDETLRMIAENKKE